MSRETFVKLEIAFLLALPAWIGFWTCAGGYPTAFETVYMIAYFYLVAGWVMFFARVLPNVAIDWLSVGLAVACLIILVCGLHCFCAWLSREIASRKAALDPIAKQEPSAVPAWKWQTTLSIVGIIVLMFVAGIAAVGVVHQLIWLRTRP